ncbi:MAG: hypothetical protein O8C66_08385 [Candidatus Methanoperedens sp.]|nr:hypothetical protein [Candidatus Methanoperedens sp.]MCZ7370514.1 hypothetical protein [Candidatus Methanoperedens sp.]
MELRHFFLVTALFSIAILAIPAIFSLLGGQHWFYDSNNSYCVKCHSDIKSELLLSGIHTSFTCENCHVLNTSSNLTHGNVISPRCLDCHGTSNRTVDSDGNTSVSPLAKVFGENIMNDESHNPFITGANSSPFLKGENEACVSCHTAKSLTISMLYALTYEFNADRTNDSSWQLSNYSKNDFSRHLLIQDNESTGIHEFPALTQLKCEKCHSETRDQLNSSFHHKDFSCGSCHQLYSSYHASSVPPCLYCHGATPLNVTDQNGNPARTAPVYAGDLNGPDAHIPFVISANNSNISTGNDVACTSCHSSFNTNISFTRPSFIEWDVVDSSGTWTIENLTYGLTKEVNVTKYLNGKIHNISDISGIDCISCHSDINDAVISGGHSNEQWKQKHNFTDYTDMNSYCKSCHRPSTQNSNGTTPYPAYPFNSPNHGAIQITCLDCHGKPDLLVNLNENAQIPVYNSTAMGGIENSIGAEPAFIQSYLCMACKNTNNPVPNNSLHFKIYTEPQVTIYINGTQQ